MHLMYMGSWTVIRALIVSYREGSVIMSLRVHVYGGKWLSTSTINEQTLGVARLQGPKRGSRHANSDNLEKIMRE